MQPLPDDIEIFTTADGSPTLVFKRADGYVEKMHHTGGALAESLYIYHQALEITLKAGLKPRVLSLGLGLGYNELISLAEFERAGISDFAVYSFEALPILRESFQSWAEGKSDSAITKVMEQTALMVSTAMGISYASLRELSAKSLANRRLQLLGPYPDALSDVQTDFVEMQRGPEKGGFGPSGLARGIFNTVYYDAYSNKMDPHLWAEDVVTGRLGPLLSPDCALATYAATGALNRSLKALGFRLIPKAGFQGKRQSTLGIRGQLV